MAKRPSPTLIKTHRVYTPAEAAEALNVHRQTVRRWINEHGLHADNTQKPWLIRGADLKSFLGTRRAKNQCRLELHHCYCFRCRGPRAPDGKMADYVHQTQTSGLLTALCPTCSTIMNKVIRRADLDVIRAKVDVTIKQADARLVSLTKPLPNVTLEKDAETLGQAQPK